MPRHRLLSVKDKSLLKPRVEDLRIARKPARDEPLLEECLSGPMRGPLMRPSRPKQTERVMEKQSDIIKEIFTNLKDYSYHQIRTILGYLATNSYGDMVTEQLGHIVLNELNKRKRVLGPAIVE